MRNLNILLTFSIVAVSLANAAISYSPSFIPKTCGMDFNGTLGYPARIWAESPTIAYNFPFDPASATNFEKAKALLAILMTAKSTSTYVELTLTDSWIAGQKPFIGVQLNP
jgi:hypothetical protein